ncbi:MAG: hypothetical protein U0805_23340, partial [Pirellulales bacterium]
DFRLLLRQHDVGQLLVQGHAPGRVVTCRCGQPAETLGTEPLDHAKASFVAHVFGHRRLPFFLFSDEDQQLLKPGWKDWLALPADDFSGHDDNAFLLQAWAAAHQHDAQVKREIAMTQLKLQAVQAGLTSLWEVTLHPPAGHWGRSQWVVVPGRDSRQATENAIRQFPGYLAGPVRRVTGG